MKKASIPAVGGYKVYFHAFDNIEAMQAFTKQELSRLSPHNRKIHQMIYDRAELRIKLRKRWFGSPIPNSIKELEEHQDFLGMERFYELQPYIRQHLHSHLPKTTVETSEPKLRYNDRGLGTFSFDRTAMGLYQLQKISKETPLQILQSQVGIALGRTQPRTTVRNVYAYYQKEATPLKTINLYIHAGGSSKIAGDGLYYTGLACAELCRYLENRQIQVSLHIMIGASSGRSQYLSSTCVKKPGQPLDLNQLMLLGSDPRYFRWHGYFHFIALYNHHKARIPQTLGEHDPDLVRAFVENHLPDGALFQASYSLDAAVKEVKRIMQGLG